MNKLKMLLRVIIVGLVAQIAALVVLSPIVIIYFMHGVVTALLVGLLLNIVIGLTFVSLDECY